MKFNPSLRKATELGIGLAAIATLILAGCGGSKSSDTGTNNTATPTAAVTIKVTPGKGVMYGASVVIKNASGVQVGTGTTSATTGDTSVTLTAGATGPFVVSVSCGASCTYFDEKTMAMVNGSATTPAMQAVLPGTGSTDVGVTAATHAAAQYAQNSGALTPASVLAANDAVRTLLGLPAGTNVLTPPAPIKDAATLTAAQSGVTAADQVAKISAAMSIAASGVSAIQAINDYGLAWKQAALVPATGVILPPTINAASMVVAAPSVPVVTISNVAAAVTLANTAAASAVADVNAYLAEAVTAGNSNSWWIQAQTFNASGVATSTTLVAQRMSFTATAANTYSATGTGYTSTNNGPNNGPWTSQPVNALGDYKLTSTGWVANANGGVLVNNLDGTVTITPTGLPAQVETITRINLSGTAIVCPNFAGGVCPVPGNYPANSFFTSSNFTSAVDTFHLQTGGVVSTDKVTGANGVQLTALPALNTTFCVQQFGGAQVFVPIAGAVAPADNYNVFGALTCSAADITNATAAGVLPWGTVTIGAKATGIAAVPTVGLCTVTTAVGSPNTLAVGWLNDNIVAVMNGLAYSGWRSPAGPRTDINDLNKTAVNAELLANGYLALP